MANYFDKFPLIGYNIDRSKFNVNEYTAATNILVRLRVVREKLNAVFHYYEYTIKSFDRPDTVAENIYGDPELHWLVLLSNDMIDPLYDWPLEYEQFDNYLANKYRQTPSQSNADALAYTKTTIDHYEKISKIVNMNTGVETVKTMRITAEEYSKLVAESMPITPVSPQTITVGSDVMQVYDWVTNVKIYDYEDQKNEAKRQIRLIKPAYITQIKFEFDNIMRSANPSYRSTLRRLL